MYKNNLHTGNTLLIGIVAMVAAAVLALSALSFAEETSNTPEPQPAPSGGAQQGGQGEDKCSQIHSYQGGDRCEKERMLLQNGCGTDISPECKGGGSGYPSGPGPQGGGKRVEVQNGIATCYDEEGRWTQDQECQKAAGTYHEPGQQQWGNQSGWTPHESAGFGGPMPGYQIDRPDHRGGPSKYHGSPNMDPGGYNMGQGGFPGMGGGMMGGPGGGMGGHMSCDMFDDMIDETQSRFAEIDGNTADQLEEMRDRVQEQAEAKIEYLQDKIDETDDEKKIAKYQKQIAKIEAKISKQITKMEARFQKQMAKMKAKMEKELARMKAKAAECEDREDEGGDFSGGEWEGGGFGGGQMAPSFSPGGGNPFGF